MLSAAPMWSAELYPGSPTGRLSVNQAMDEMGKFVTLPRPLFGLYAKDSFFDCFSNRSPGVLKWILV
jgi:hypothetical protein